MTEPLTDDERRALRCGQEAVSPSHSSPLTEAELRDLREKAQKATPGPWKQDRNWTITGPNNDWDRHWMAPLVGQDLSKFDPFYTEIVTHIHGPGRERGNRADADFDFIAACDPQTVLRLVDELERLRVDNIELRAELNIREEENEKP